MTIAKTFPARKHEALNFAESGVNYTMESGVARIHPPCRAVIVGSAGAINGRQVDMADLAATAELPVGMYILQFTDISEAGTTAGAITLLW